MVLSVYNENRPFSLNGPASHRQGWSGGRVPPLPLLRADLSAYCIHGPAAPYTHGLLPLLQPHRVAALTLPCPTHAESARPGLLSSWPRSVLRLRWHQGPPRLPIHLWLPMPWSANGEWVGEDAGVSASIRPALRVLEWEGPGCCWKQGSLSAHLPTQILLHHPGSRSGPYPGVTAGEISLPGMVKLAASSG